MSGPAPKETRRRRNVPARGDWKAAPSVGWQHGNIPAPPTGLLPASRRAWDSWFTAWFASNWEPADLPLLRQVIRLFDTVESGRANSADRAELRQMADSFGITKKGQQDRRWAPPKADDRQTELTATAPADRYAHLKVV